MTHGINDINLVNRAEIENLVGPFLLAPSFQRLEKISFLGILSPKYARFVSAKFPNRILDGSRACHSVGVADVYIQMCRDLNLNDVQKKYAVAWSLSHDLGNWALSHTAQYAFTKLLGVETKTVREWLILNDSRITSKYWSAQYFEDCGIDVERLINLMRKKPDPELELVSMILRSPITPDMVEGVWRSGQSFGKSMFTLAGFSGVIYNDMLKNVRIHPDSEKTILEFWKHKKFIYKKVFSAKRIVKIESDWAAAVLKLYHDSNLSLNQSLDIDEEKLVEETASVGIQNVGGLHRWKAPVRHRIAATKIPDEFYLDSLSKFLIEEPGVIKPSEKSRGLP